MVCPLKEQGTSALSASPRRLTEGVLEVKGVHYSRLLILGSTKDDGDGTTLPCVSIMGCPLKELGTSALSASWECVVHLFCYFNVE